MIIATLSESTLSVDPGQSVKGSVVLGNDGPDPVRVDVAVTGAAAPYSWVAPTQVTLDPGASVPVGFGFHLPRASVPAAGSVPFQVTATPPGGEAAAVSVAGVLDVRPFAVLSAILVPTSDGNGSHELTVGNRGNAAVSAALRADVAPEAGLDVRIEPQAVTVSPDREAKASVRVAAGRRARRGKDGTIPFRVLVEPELGTPVEAAGQFRQEATRSVRPGLVVAVVAVLALVAGAVALISGGGSGSDESGDTQVAAGAAKLDPCPAKGHTDAFGIRGLQPDEIAKLPNAYTFTRVKADGCSPVRFNPCEPVHYVQNAEAAGPGVVADVQEAFRRLSQATGITFVDDGFTDEPSRTGPYVPGRYGSRWAPILILWEHFPAEQTTGERQVFGQTTPMREQDVVVSARLRFNVDAYNDEATKTPIPAGFGPPANSGAGPIGRYYISWGRIILHELAHMVGLGHTRDPSSLMYPDAAQHTSRPADLTPPDLLGLRYLGKEAGCLTSPPVPTA